MHDSFDHNNDFKLAFIGDFVVKQVSSSIMITRPYDLYPLAPHFYILKLRFTAVYIIFLFLL